MQEWGNGHSEGNVEKFSGEKGREANGCMKVVNTVSVRGQLVNEGHKWKMSMEVRYRSLKAVGVK